MDVIENGEVCIFLLLSDFITFFSIFCYFFVFFLFAGYQRELTYRHSDGSYSAFGERGGNAGSTWLTAFVVKSFAQARPYIFIDELDLELSVDYLKTTQNPEDGPLKGCFFETYVQWLCECRLWKKHMNITCWFYCLALHYCWTVKTPAL